MPTIAAQQLRDFAIQLLAAAGIPADEAKTGWHKSGRCEFARATIRMA